ncbi:MAG: hypothetical protein H6671_18075 [Anaerolineaceae bacterium]|nr:hypothetical protein [Anaerolineaceae bacterium]
MYQTRRKAVWIIFTTGVLLLTRIHILFAQVNIPVICGSGTPQSWQPTLPGTYFHLIESPYDEKGSSNYRFEAMSASGNQVYSVPFPPEIGLDLFTPSTSPDGRYMVFRPTSSEVGLTVWDLQTNATASLLLEPTDLDYLTFNISLSYQRNNNLLIWLDSRHLLLQYYFDDSSTISIDWMIASKVYTIQEAPFSIVESTRQDIIYPELPVPQGNRLPRTEFSPDHHYAVHISEQATYGVSVGDPRIQIYDLQTGGLVYDNIPTTEAYPIDKLIWMQNSNLVFLLLSERNTSLWKVVELHIDDTFLEDWDLQQLINNTFGMEAGIASMIPVVSPSGESIMLEVYVPATERNYLLLYTPSMDQITAFCDYGPGALTEETYPFWGPYEQDFAYYSNGELYVTNLEDGAYTVLPSDRLFVGWSSQDIFLTPTATVVQITTPPTAGMTIATPTAVVGSGGS